MRTVFSPGRLCLLLVAGCVCLSSLLVDDRDGPPGPAPAPAAIASMKPQPLGSGPPVRRGVGGPVAVLADGRPIELPYRSLFPFVGDLDGDGRRDLLLGTPDAGRLEVFPNVGTNAKPVLGAPSWFDERVADGRIPKG